MKIKLFEFFKPDWDLWRIVQLLQNVFRHLDRNKKQQKTD